MTRAARHDSYRKPKNTRAKPLRDVLKELGPRATCMTPHKVKHRTLKIAEAAAEHQWKMDRRILYPYMCGDHYHLTSQNWKVQKENGH